jgi:hypothetical protein
MHSNDNVRIGGSSNTFDGALTYVSTISISGGSNTFNPPHTTAPPKDWPVTFDQAVYRDLAFNAAPGDKMYYRAGNIDWSYIDSRGDGLYYATGKIDVSGSGPIVQRWTAGVGSTLPSMSTAWTRNWCWPAARPVSWCGVRHSANAAPSSEHSKLEPSSLDENAKLALVSCVIAGGDALIVVSGAVVSTIVQT